MDLLCIFFKYFVLILHDADSYRSTTYKMREVFSFYGVTVYKH